MFKMYPELTLLLLSFTSLVSSQKCDQTPLEAQELGLPPSKNKDAPFKLRIETEDVNYVPGQTYVLILETMDNNRTFQEFMITVEDPDVDNNDYNFERGKDVDVGSLKTLEDKSRHSERCHSSVENADLSVKKRIEIHWISPKTGDNNQRIRFRAMVAENKEAWYTGDQLTIVLDKDDAKPIDSPPHIANRTCNLCSEARYELIFNGQWSRGSHPLNYPNKPDENKYSQMIGASHDYGYNLWRQRFKANDGMKALAEEANVSILEKDIIANMSATNGTRTLIRGQARKHPDMSKPSHSLFRVDRIHHLFSIAVAMKPSPDWFLGTSRFDLCTQDGWLEYHEIKMYPWDAGTRNGISYDSPTTMTLPEDNIERVALGSFNKESPFYQMNLNDLKPFAVLQVRRLDVYELIGVDCSEQSEDTNNSEDAEEMGEMLNIEAEDAEPMVAESRQGAKCFSEWSDWSRCNPDQGICGIGTQVRVRFEEDRNFDEDQNDLQVKPIARCERNSDAALTESQSCYIDC